MTQARCNTKVLGCDPAYALRLRMSNYCPKINDTWTNYIKGPILHFEFTEELIIIKVLTKITIKHKTMMKCEVKSNFIIKAELSV